MRKSRRLSLEVLAPYLHEPPSEPAPLNPLAIFGNDHPLEIEIGCGKGLFLLTAAESCPAVNFLGVEIARKYQLHAATRIAKRGLRNARLVRADARLFLRDYVPSDTVQAIHVYFPDPWWKQRHLKRRVFTLEFAGQCERALRPGGQLHVVTDVAEYFRVITELLAERPGLRPLPAPAENQPADEMDYLTNFERKFRLQGRAIYRGVWEGLGLRGAADGERVSEPVA